MSGRLPFTASAGIEQNGAGAGEREEPVGPCASHLTDVATWAGVVFVVFGSDV